MTADQNKTRTRQPQQLHALLANFQEDEEPGLAAAATLQNPNSKDEGSAALPGRVVASVIENRAREVGLAVLELSTLTLRLSQYIEPGRSYAVTQMLLQLVNATEIVVVSSRERQSAVQQTAGVLEAGVNAVLRQRATADAYVSSTGRTAKASMPAASAAAATAVPSASDKSDGEVRHVEVYDNFRGFSVHSLPRACFDDTQGGQLLASYGSEDSRGLVAAVTGKSSQYLALGAAGALLHHVLGPVAVAMALGTPLPRGQAAATAAATTVAGGGGSGAQGIVALRCHCMRVEQLHAGLHMRLDPGLVNALEIIQPAVPMGRSAAGGGPPAAGSLLRLMGSSMRTAAGLRLLRSSLLQPLADLGTLNMRYDTIEELIREDMLAFDLGQVLTLLPRDLDKVCYSLAAAGAGVGGAGGGASGVGTAASSDPGRGIGELVRSLLLLRDMLSLLEPLANALKLARSPLLAAIRTNCNEPRLLTLKQRVDEVLDEDATGASSRAPFISRIQQCFAIRAEAAPGGLLEMARGSLCRLTESVHGLGARYAQEMELPGLKISYNSRKGFYLTLPPPGGTGKGSGGGGGRKATRGRERAADASAGGHEAAGTAYRTTPNATAPAVGGDTSVGAAAQLAPQLMVLERRGNGALLLTTHELNALNTRLRDATFDCLLLTRQLLESVVSEAFAQLGALQRLVDSLALLDMMVGLADLVANGPMGQCCRPKLQLGGPLAIVQGRHPLLAARNALAATGGEGAAGGSSVQPNDSFVSSSAPLHIITGPNMSGKSTYLHQVALLVVMAQAGCWVPADFFALSPFTALLGRLGCGGGGGSSGGLGPEDDLESGSSSFLTEMQDATAVLASATSRSLVLLDELGRATSTADGVGLAWAICEELMTRGSATLLATHFPQLGELAVLYPQARLWKLQVDTTAGALDFRWLLQPAAALDYCHYGLMLAEAAGMPGSVVAEARRIAEMLEETERRRLEVCAGGSGLWATAASVCSRLTVLAQQWRSGGATVEGAERAIQLLRGLQQEASAVPLEELQRELMFEVPQAAE